MSSTTVFLPGQTYCSLGQAATYLGYTERFVRNKISDGDLRAFRVKGSRALRVRVADLDELLVPVPTAGGGAA